MRGAALVAGAALALSACGGGDPEVPAANAVRPVLAAASPPAADPASVGAWSEPFSTGVLAIHVTLQPDGRVFYFGREMASTSRYTGLVGLWDPALGAAGVALLPSGGGTFFCSAQTLLGDGRTFIAGSALNDNVVGTGTPRTTVFDARTGQLEQQAEMARPRWYASTTVLMNGEVYIQGGTGGADRAEVRRPDGTLRSLTGMDTSRLNATYPKNWLAPDGKVFGISATGQMYTVDPSGDGTLALAAQLPAVNAGDFAGAAMFRPGRILKLSTLSPSAVVIDINGPRPVVQPALAAAGIRSSGMATLLADGRVLATGGSAIHNDLSTALPFSEIWDPVSGQWTRVGGPQRARLYHGTALLLPDARVLIAGGGAPGPLTNRTGEVYTPPYLFDAAGLPARRPAIVSAPDTLLPSQGFALQANAPVQRVTLVRAGSATHSWNTDQRFLELPLRATGAAGGYRVQLPSRVTDTPPGFYMLFAFDAAGVPSVARMLRIDPPAVRDADAAPAPQPLPPQASRVGEAVSLQPSLTGAGTQPLAWSASDLPPGLSIDPATGRVSGTTRAAGSHYVTLAADDGRAGGSTSFVWEVSSGNLALAQPLPASAAVAGTTATFTAQARGTDLSYSWDFGDGSAATPWSAAPDASHSFGRPGLYAVSVTAMSLRGQAQTRSFLQAVGLPVQPGKPARSSALVLEPGADGGRVWLANPDAGTVSVFAASSLQKLAEIRVGNAPATLALAGDGSIWVANHGSDAISVIDPVALAVTRTLALEPGAAPWGIIAAPGDPASMYAVLEGPGQLVRFDVPTRMPAARQSLGANARHLSASADGQRLFVSRFISPPLPGESTATVQSTRDGQPRGGELLVFDAALRPVKTVVLGVSTRPDAENQGRGLPNYLGALAISPDGSQGFLPSKQDNVQRGALRDGQQLNFSNTVRAISSRIVLPGAQEDMAGRIDHDNAGVASAATFDPRGVLLFVALETSREVAVLSAQGRELMRIDTGHAPQSLEVSPDGRRLYVGNFMSRTLSVYDLGPLTAQGRLQAPLIRSLRSVAVEPLAPAILLGKRLFHDARDPRLARDRYLSCAACHAGAGHDGRTWDMTGFGEGLRNTPSLLGRGSGGRGALHWTGNLDEVQDLETQIRLLAGGTGLLSSADYAASAPALGAAKAGRSAELDAIAAYVASLQRAPSGPAAQAGGLSVAAASGAALFARQCAQCHGGPGSSDSGGGRLHDVGTLKPASGRRGGQPLTGLDTPSLAGVWATAPYLHDGSAPTLEAAIAAHAGGGALDAAALANLSAYLQEDGPRRQVPPLPAIGPAYLLAAGSARLLADGQVLLTPLAPAQSGAAWLRDRWPTALPFTTRFDFSLRRGAGTRQEAGLALVLHGGRPEDGAPAAGCIAPCASRDWLALAVRTGTANRLGLAERGSPPPAAGLDLGGAATVEGTAELSYDPAARLLKIAVSYRADGKAGSATARYPVDLAARFGPAMTVGVTGASTTWLAEHSVRNWSARFTP